MDPTRARFVEHEGERLYLIDLEGLPATEVLAVADRAAREIGAEPPRSVLTLTHLKGVPLDRRVVDKLTWLADADRGHVRAAAIAGLSPLQRFVYEAARILSRRDFRLFDTVDEAKDWLVSVVARRASRELRGPAPSPPP